MVYPWVHSKPYQTHGFGLSMNYNLNHHLPSGLKYQGKLYRQWTYKRYTTKIRHIDRLLVGITEIYVIIFMTRI